MPVLFPSFLLRYSMKPLFYLVAAFFMLSVHAVSAADFDVQSYRRAFADIGAGRADYAVAQSRRGGDPVLNKVLRGILMAKPGNDYSFAELADFIQNNPDWPGLGGIVAIAEQKIPAAATADQINEWFSAHPPVTLNGVNRFAAALTALGDGDGVIRLVRARWVNNDFSDDDQRQFWSRYGAMLDSAAHWEKLDRLLWKGDFVKARRVYPYVGSAERAVADARIALATRTHNSQILLDRVPGKWRRDPGLQYELLKWYVAGRYDDRAVDILLHAPDSPGHVSAWWDLRQTVARRVIERHDFDLAYRLASAHDLTEGKDFLQAEFLSGWLAFRLLDQPGVAEDHFRALYESAKMPVSRARAAYWLGRVFEQTGNKSRAEQAYSDAAAYDLTFYGQLAATRLSSSPTLTIESDPPIPPKTRQGFGSSDIVAAIARLYAVGEADRAHIFLKSATEAAKERSEFALLAEIAANKLHRLDYGIEVVKAANQKGFMITTGGYPMLNRNVPTPPEVALTNALVRQESMFNTGAESPVSAQGLTQLMPATAKEVARHIGMKFKRSRLAEPDYNLRLGTAYLQDLISRFGGSYVLALAAYNAGPGRVNEWVRKYGDPRSASIDAVDWIELIPVYETRNYVQRILENVQIYRARKNNGEAPLLITRDLNGGRKS